MRRALFALTVVAVLIGAAPVSAQPVVVIVEVNMTVYGNEGDVIQVAQAVVDPTLVGATCEGTARTENNASEHPGNDLIIESGTSTGVIPNFEAVAGQITSMTTTLILGETITASIRLGPDGVASEGILIQLSCAFVQEPPETTTTTTTAPPPETTTTTAPPPEPTTTTTAPPPEPTTTTQPPATTTTGVPEDTTTTEPPPEGGVEAGGGSTAGTPDDDAAWLVGVGALILLGALVTLAVARARISSED